MTRAELIRYQNRFSTDHAIGLQLGISRQAVHQLRKKFGISRSLEKDFRNGKIQAEYHNKGMNAKQLSKKYKISVGQIYRII